jgi:hypothetical protein
LSTLTYTDLRVSIETRQRQAAEAQHQPLPHEQPKQSWWSKIPWGETLIECLPRKKVYLLFNGKQTSWATRALWLGRHHIKGHVLSRDEAIHLLARHCLANGWDEQVEELGDLQQVVTFVEIWLAMWELGPLSSDDEPAFMAAFVDASDYRKLARHQRIAKLKGATANRIKQWIRQQARPVTGREVSLAVGISEASTRKSLSRLVKAEPQEVARAGWGKYESVTKEGKSIS